MFKSASVPQINAFIRKILTVLRFRDSDNPEFFRSKQVIEVNTGFVVSRQPRVIIARLLGWRGGCVNQQHRRIMLVENILNSTRKPNSKFSETVLVTGAEICKLVGWRIYRIIVANGDSSDSLVMKVDVKSSDVVQIKHPVCGSRWCSR